MSMIAKAIEKSPIIAKKAKKNILMITAFLNYRIRPFLL